MISDASVGAIRDAACKDGMYTLRESGIHAVYKGLTTFDQVLAETTVES